MYFIKTYLKSEGQKKVKVNDTEYQGQMKERNFLSIANFFVSYVLRGWYTFDWKAFLWLRYFCAGKNFDAHVVNIISLI